MTEIMEKNSFYRNSVSPGRRRSFLGAYKEYCYLVSTLEAFINQYHLKNIYVSGFNDLNKDEKDPWTIVPADNQSTEEYKNFLEHMQIENENTCYVSLNYTSPRYENETAGIISAPEEFNLQIGTKPLPQKVERYVLAHPREEKISDARFIVNGKYIFSYNGIYNDKTIEEAFSDELFEERFNCILETIAQYPENMESLSEQEKNNIKNEVAASFKLAPLENAVLDALSLVADESNKILKDIIGRRVGGGYLSQAEKEGLLPSAAVLQDYLNIRHLLHHQWDTLDGIGKFNENELLKNASVRRRYLDSYAKLCDKPLKERISAYTKATEDFIPLLSVLNPDFMARENLESNNKFLGRIKEYLSHHPDEQVIAKIKYDSREKKDILTKALQRISPNIEVIDKSVQVDINHMDESMNSYIRRRLYIDMYRQIENRLCQFCLFEGKNYAPMVAWDYCHRHHIISLEEVNKWNEYKKIRNDLSHRHMDKELNAKVHEIFPKITEDYYELNAKLDSLMPELELIGENTYRAYHQNGMVVDIDYSLKKVIQVINNRGYVQRKKENDKESNIKRRPYTEEHNNGVNLEISGMEITLCHLNNGIDINFKKDYLETDDGVKLYFSNPERLYMVTPNGEKIIANERCEVIKYICRGKNVNLGRNEQLSFQNGRKLSIGSNGRLQGTNWINSKGKKMQAQYIRTDNGMLIEFDDKTKITLERGKAKVYHNDIELTYLNRKAFAESYNLPMSVVTNYNGR